MPSLRPLRNSSLPALAAVALALAAPLAAQPGLTLPPSGDNQKASVTQWIGPVAVTVDYSSPDVHAPNGDDRTGKIWGQLVPYGYATEQFGTCGSKCPWRAGANENTVFTVSHDVTVQGKPLKAGRYGLHMLPGESEWTIIFSHNSTSWGSFTYDEKEDALRVTAKSEPADYTEWLTYEFEDRKPNSAKLGLKWEKLRVPFEIAVPNLTDVYVAALEKEMRGGAGFTSDALVSASQYCLQNKVHLEKGLAWAKAAAGTGFPGQTNFQTLSNLAQLEGANGKKAEAEATWARAIDHPSAGPLDLHFLGRQLLAQKETERALAVFQKNAQRHPGVWPTPLGLARGLAAAGRRAEAIAQAKKAVGLAPDAASKANVEQVLKALEEGKAID